ncbi:trypsin-like serine peptidase [Dongia deserti]|uniref:trypsin-like serine peptidase n=1 Tax=Dongia deserti TaxID=2268030 RepID=UPI000E649FAC|nr:serine protease [Dongia deserti]
MRFAAVIAGLLLAGCAVAQPAAVPAGDSGADWHAAIMHVENRHANVVCTGVLVQVNLVATAGHCLQGAGARELLFIPAGTNHAWRGMEILAAGGITEGAEVNAVEVARDWALIRTAPMPIAPIAILPMTKIEIQKAIAQGARLASFGFAHPDALVEHTGCALLDVWGEAFFTTRCPVRAGDSGGPVLLIDAEGARLIGLNSAIRNGETLVVNAGRFAPWASADDPFNTRALAQADNQTSD